MNLRTAAGVSLSRFAHLTGLSAKPKAGAKAEEGDEKKKDEDDTAAEDGDDEGEDDKKKDAKAEDGDDGDEMDAEGDEGEDDDKKDKPDAKKSAKAARLAERARCAAIFASKAAAGRVALACQLAFTTNLSASQAIGILAAAPVEGGGSSGLGARMAKVKDIQVGDDAGAEAPSGSRAEAKKLAATTLAAARAAGANF